MPEAVTAAKTNGIAIKLEVSSANTDRFLAGKAILNHKTYPIHWGSFKGDTVVAAGKVNGYIYIDKSEFKSNLKNSKLSILVGEFLDELAKTKVAESEKSIYTSVDISPPTISATHSKGNVAITAFDSIGGVADILYSIDGGIYKKYAAPFSPPAGCKLINIKAVDNLENVGEEKFFLKGDSSGTDVVNTNVYTRKSRNFIMYTVNGTRSNTSNLNLNDFNVG